MCGSPGEKSNIILLRILSASLSLMRYSAELPLRAGQYTVCKCTNI